MILGLICILINIAASWYSAMYNEGRIVAPMDYSAYVFRIQDLPMIASVFLTWIYVLYLFILLVKAIIGTGGHLHPERLIRSWDFWAFWDSWAF